MHFGRVARPHALNVCLAALKCPFGRPPNALSSIRVWPSMPPPCASFIQTVITLTWSPIYWKKCGLSKHCHLSINLKLFRCNGQFSHPPASLTPWKDQAGPFLPRGRNWLVIFSPGEKNNQSVFSPPSQFFPTSNFSTSVIFRARAGEKLCWPTFSPYWQCKHLININLGWGKTGLAQFFSTLTRFKTCSEGYWLAENCCAYGTYTL